MKRGMIVLSLLFFLVAPCAAFAEHSGDTISIFPADAVSLHEGSRFFWLAAKSSYLSPCEFARHWELFVLEATFEPVFASRFFSTDMRRYTCVRP